MNVETSESKNRRLNHPGGSVRQEMPGVIFILDGDELLRLGVAVQRELDRECRLRPHPALRHPDPAVKLDVWEGVLHKGPVLVAARRRPRRRVDPKLILHSVCVIELQYRRQIIVRQVNLAES